jgi:hypothetical protein
VAARNLEGYEMNHDEEFERALAADAGRAYVPRPVKMSEQELGAHVRAMVDGRRLYSFTSYDFRHRHGAGWPDWVISGPGGFILRELKSNGGRLSEDQQCWREQFKLHGLDFAVWTPAELADGTIARQLDQVLGQGWS